MEDEIMFDEINNVERTIITATDSENLVRKLVSEGEYSKNIHNTIKSNIDHLDIILNRPEIKESNSPKLLDFQEAIDLGQKFITEHNI